MRPRWHHFQAHELGPHAETMLIHAYIRALRHVEHKQCGTIPVGKKQRRKFFEGELGSLRDSIL